MGYKIYYKEKGQRAKQYDRREYASEKTAKNNIEKAKEKAKFYFKQAKKEGLNPQMEVRKTSSAPKQPQQRDIFDGMFGSTSKRKRSNNNPFDFGGW